MTGAGEPRDAAVRVWADLEEVPWYALHTDNPGYGERAGYTVAEVPAATVERWQRVQAEYRAVHAEIGAALYGEDDG